VLNSPVGIKVGFSSSKFHSKFQGQFNPPIVKCIGGGFNKT
jgi:hypothetical protein